MTMDLRRLLESALPAGVEWAALRRVRSVERSYAAKDGAFESAALYEDEGFMIEVLSGGQFGYAGLAAAGPAAMAAAAARALELARSASGRSIHRFGTEVRPATALSYETPRGRRAAPGADLLAGGAVALSRAMRVSDKIVQASAEISTRDLETEYVSTSGAAICQRTHIVCYGCAAVAREGSTIQKRTLNGPRGRTRQGGYELLDFPRIEAEAARAAEQAIELLGARDCPSMRADLVLAPDQMMLQIHESIGHPLELDRILGDERNYAGSTFVRLEDIGSLRYGSELMNVSFDPTVAGEAASYGADDIGAPARKELVIKDGILVRALGSLESQARSGKAGVANQRAEGWHRSPIDRMANLNVEPGKDALPDIIASVERGVWMEANRSWSIDDYRNKFQFGCEYGKLIEDGELTRTVRNPNYRGVSSSFWRSLYKVGDASTFQVFGTPNCGKGEPNQVITTGHASPVCAFRGVEIFGGEQ
ncbi:MAG TPA: TldD/PmbA family protein [Spirochaetia bacterium]|nr:TldD/PmbA family protein [Spirochaetia bacterium]HRZ64624.1 TldD/PmbA family protein [Spirochaetia bacterium]